ncbi:hypothetical protein DSCA_35470 [Desulfosarcina alkanivorans]|uniref:Uncharacterized protein n=1 Tax=Desulfosarcina alkanivorans TaxID=571177 RepID=A0A5K7YYD2_9BACT|nr:hypothetical protein [Desulfosarcina alkanivorans]BBO69617.1 hypothetical protein DSCA_35470 [Desulfosarcina alkanivorans]
MADYPIVNRNQPQLTSLGQGNLPDFYMEDFSVLGLCVNDCDLAADILKHHRFALRPSHGSMTVQIKDAFHAAAAVGLLNEHGLACELADVALGMYQG